MDTTDSDLRSVDIPRPAASPRTRAEGAKPHLNARVTGWVIEMRTRIRELELDNARSGAELEMSARVERGAQRYADRLEAELERSRQREATLARALGYAEAERDQLARQVAGPEPAPRPLSGRRRGK